MNAASPTLVIGAGVAGLACARRLHASGHPSLVVERSRGCGGRAGTRRRSGTSANGIDLGAQYFTVRDPGFAAVTRRARVEGALAPWTPRLVRIDADGVREVTGDETRLVGVPGMSAFGRWLAGPLQMRSRMRATELVGGPGDWHLCAVEGGGHAVTLGPFSRVVVAVTPALAAPLLAPAKALAERATQTAMHPCWAAWVELPSGFECGFDAAFVETGGPLAWLARDASRPGRDGAGWLLHANAEWSRAHLQDDPQEVGGQLGQAFAALLAGTAAALTAAPRPTVVHLWRSARPIERDDARLPLPDWDSATGIGICGDWCAGQARIEAAWRSGDALGTALAAHSLKA